MTGGIAVSCENGHKSTGSISYSLAHFTLAAGDETLQFLQQLSSSTRSEVEEWSSLLASEKPQPSPEFPGISDSLELLEENILFSLANSFIASFNTSTNSGSFALMHL